MMKIAGVIMLVAVLCWGVREARGTSVGEQPPAEPTFYRDVLPILQNRCQECHRPGEAGPMPLQTYAEVKPWVRKIRGMAATGRMPPWFSDDPPGRFSNDRRLSESELRTLLNWIDAGAPEGNPEDAPNPPEFATGWSIGEPDAVVAMPRAFDVPARGVIEYQYLLVPTGFTEDRWVQAIEIRPTERSVIHHIQVYVRPPGSRSFRDRPVGEFWTVGAGTLPEQDDGVGVILAAGEVEQVCVYVPGGTPCELREGQGRLVPAGSDLYFIIHYQATGTPVADQSRVGFRFAKQPPRERVRNFFLANHGLRIPPGAPNHQVSAQATLARPAKLISLMPHMHLRGKAFYFRLTYPDGRSEVVLNVPRYDPHWQLTYKLAEQLVLPEGTTIEAVGTFDNSAANHHNPDPTQEVRWGLQSWEEMHTGFFDLAVPADEPVTGLFRPKSP